MTIPAFEMLMLPMLELMSDLQPRRNREISDALREVPPVRRRAGRDVAQWPEGD